MSPTSDAVESYLESVPETGRAFFLGVRELVLRHAPHATETMSYNMPTFLVDGHRLLHASAWTEHLAIYPLPPAEDLDPDGRRGPRGAQLGSQHAQAALPRGVPDPPRRRGRASAPREGGRRPLTRLLADLPRRGALRVWGIRNQSRPPRSTPRAIRTCAS